MKKILLILASSVLLGGCTIRNPFLKKPAGIEIASTPPATVFLSGEEVGTTPYSAADLTPGQYQIRLVPQDQTSNLAIWETQLTLKPEVTTIISKSFAEAETDSSSYILELRPEPGDETFISVISDPDTVNLNIDGKPTGYTPVAKLDSTPGSHQLSLTSPGYKPLDLSVNVVKGYNLLVNIKLASDEILLTSPPPASTSASSSPTESTDSLTNRDADTLTPHVIIQETGTGWLRVRQEPSSSGEELGKADVGETLPYLGETSDTGWHQVEFEEQEGWLSAKYATLVK